jgi:type IV pilus assembly protein PilX
MRKSSSTPTSIRHRQRGAILVTSLLLLLVLTVLGITMMKMTNMQERMSGNTRDISLALQGAEAALRDGERIIDPFINGNVAGGQGGLGCNICQSGVLPMNIADPGAFNWGANAHEFGILGTQDFVGLAEDPQYTIEEGVYVPDDLGGRGQGVNPGRQFYQVTGHSIGASGLANVVLQTSYARQM